jgi:GNAT superfamily N-acetyltransferase
MPTQLITEEQIAPAGEALGRAFFAAPLWKYFLPDEEHRRRVLLAHFTAVVRYGHLFAQVYTTPSTEGAAVWLPPGAGEMTDDRLEQAGLLDIPAIAGEENMQRFDAVMAFVDPFHKRDMPAEHWNLMILGVDPSAQGTGVGGRLVRAGIERADADGVPCYTDTQNEKNVTFYQHLGFDVIVDTIEPTSGLGVWTFRRDAKP